MTLTLLLLAKFCVRHRWGWGTGNKKGSPSRPDVGTAPFKYIVTSVVAGISQSEHTIGDHLHRMINTRLAPIEEGLNDTLLKWSLSQIFTLAM